MRVPITADLDLVLARLDNIDKTLDLARSEQNVVAMSAATSSSPWYAKLLQYLAVPAAIIAIFVQRGQFTLNSGTTEKTAAETQKIKIESAKTQVELQKTLLDFENARSTTLANQPALNETIDKVRQTITDVSRLREAEVKGALTCLLN